MTDKQQESLRIADLLERDPSEWGGLKLGWKAASELRRLHEENKELRAALAQPESTCANCARKDSDGWALYCVDCVSEFYKPDHTNHREWVGLSPEDYAGMRSRVSPLQVNDFVFTDIVAMTQAKLKEKNL